MRLFPLLLLIVLAGPAAARDAALACVQGQLAVLGQDAGPIDGLWGPRTRKGAAIYRAELGASLPPLRAGNAGVWCRWLGERDRRLSALWPSRRDGAVKVEVAGLDPDTQSAIQMIAEDMLRGFEVRFSLRLAETITLVAGRTDRDLRPMWTRALGGQGRGFEAIYAQSCGGGQIGGFASGNVVALCLPKGGARLSDHDLWLFQTTVAHEIFHAVQRQLVGRPTSRMGTSSDSYAGPEWLIEGSATFASLRVTLGDLFFAPSYGRLLARLSGNRTDLAELETYRARVAQVEALYDNGSLATFELIGGGDGRALIRFYEAIGLGRPWREAFGRAFGVTAEEFYEIYRTGGDTRASGLQTAEGKT